MKMADESNSDVGWGSLFPHIIVDIFKNLDIRDKFRTSLVCKSWFQCAHAPEVWRNVYINMKKRCHVDGVPKLMEKHGCHFQILKLTVNQSEQRHIKAACEILYYFCVTKETQLSSLTIQLAGVSLGHEVLLFDSLKRLFEKYTIGNDHKYLRHFGLHGKSLAFEDSVYASLADNNPKIECVDLCIGCIGKPYSKMSQKSLVNFAQKCQYLQEISTYLQSMSDHFLLELASDERVHIRKLNIICQQNTAFVDLTSSSWQILMSRSPTMTVSVVIDDNFSQEQIQAILKPDIPVTEISMVRYEVSSEDINYIEKYFKHTLKKFQAFVAVKGSNCAIDDALISLATNCINLSSLYIFVSLQKQTIHTILDVLPDMKRRETYMLSQSSIF